MDEIKMNEIVHWLQLCNYTEIDLDKRSVNKNEREKLVYIYILWKGDLPVNMVTMVRWCKFRKVRQRYNKWKVLDTLIEQIYYNTDTRDNLLEFQHKDLQG